jgi:hypothetical protein
LKLYRITGPSLKSVPEMLDEFAGIDTDPKPSPIVCIFQMMLVCGEAQ